MKKLIKMRKIIGSILLAQLVAFNCFATPYKLPLDMSQAESRFLQKNLLLLSAKYNITISKALEQQAKLWNNPTISFEQNIYNQYTGKYFDMSSSGQSAVQIQQLILLAGKRNKQLQLQKYSTAINEYQFYDLMRTLRLELTSNFYSLYFSQRKLFALNKQILPLRDLERAYEEQFKKGNVSLKEVSRLRSLLFKLETDRISLVNEELGFTSALKTLLVVKGDTTLEPIYQESVSSWLENKKLAELEEEAIANRSDLLAYETNVKLQQANYTLQKANAIPDINVGAAYDRAGSYIYNYYAMTLSFSLPVYNRNQHFIKIAKDQIDQSKLDYENRTLSLSNEVNYSYMKALEFHNSYVTFSKSAFENVEQLQKVVIENYQKRNITLMEFVDFYESYKDNISAFLDLQLAREKALEELNYTIGKKIN
jgi:outer membrane protein, heavy metal efflux system